MVTTKKKGCCDKANEAKTRRELVAAALRTAWFDSEAERASAVESYSKSTLTFEEILMLTEGLRELTKNAGKVKSRVFGSNSRAMAGIA